MITSGCCQGAAAEEDPVGELQLKQTQLREQQAEADTIKEQHLKPTQSEHSLDWPPETSACQRHYHTRLLVHQSRCLQWRENCHMLCCADTNGSESSSNLCTIKKCTYQAAHIGDWGAAWNRWTGVLDWTGILDCMEYRNDLNCCKKPFSW